MFILFKVKWREIMVLILVRTIVFFVNKNLKSVDLKNGVVDKCLILFFK